jgi:hypothetical protein
MHPFTQILIRDSKKEVLLELPGKAENNISCAMNAVTQPIRN